jgi:AAA15 family ATPase/GTPase
MGDGMRRILAYTASLVSAENGVVLVDEIDTGLHYSVQTDMWRLVLETAEALNVQVFATTHSWDCIEAFQEAMAEEGWPERGQLLRVSRDGDATRAVLYSGEELAIATAQEIEVR